jgi:hypothetical protein
LPGVVGVDDVLDELSFESLVDFVLDEVSPAGFASLVSAAPSFEPLPSFEPPPSFAPSPSFEPAPLFELPDLA